MSPFFNFLGRLCICSIFIFSSIQDCFEWGIQEDHILNTLNNYINSYPNRFYINSTYQLLMSNAAMFLLIGIALKFFGGFYCSLAGR
jgi:hypothetical protein